MRISLSIIFVLLFAIQLSAQEEINLPEPHWKLYRLTNQNISVLQIQNTQNPVFQAELHLPLGFNIQDSTNAGILRIFSQLFFQNTEKFPMNQDIQAQIKQVGLEVNYRISTDGFHAQVLAPSPNALQAIQMLRDWVLYPKITDIEWVRAKMMFAQWLQLQEQNPVWILKSETNKILTSSHADKLGNSGNFGQLNKWSPQQFNDFRSFWLYPNQGLLTICSPLSPQKLEIMMDSVWKDWKPAIQMPKDLTEETVVNTLANDSTHIITFEKSKVPQALITWLPDSALSGFSNELITSGLIKWLNWKGNYIQANSGNWKLSEFYFDPKNTLNYLEMNCIAKVGDWKNAWDSLQYSLHWLKNYTMTDDETQMIQNWLLADVDFANESPIDFAHGLGNHWVRFGNLEYIYLKDSILSIKTEQLQQVKNQWFDKSKKNVVFIANSADQGFLNPENWLFPPKQSDSLAVHDTVIAENKENVIKKEEIPFESIETEKEQFFFELNSYKVDTVSKVKLAKFAKFLHDYPELRVKLHGHSDTRGDAAYNMVLSKKRVESVKWLLIKRHQIDPKRIYSKAWGETKPSYPEDKPENIGKNRRVELEIFVP